jgi:predicted dehydrogenase
VLSGVTDDGTLLSTTVATGTSDANEVELAGERGRLTLTLFRGSGPQWAPTGEAGGGVGVRLRAVARAAATLPRQARHARLGGDYLLSFAEEWRALAAAARSGGPPPAGFADGRRAVALALAAERSLGSGREVEIAA